MPNIYVGNIKKMYVKKLEVNGRNIKRVLGDEILEKNSEFYINRFGRTINFKYDNYLPTRQEAMDYTLSGWRSEMIFVDYEELQFDRNITNKEFKDLKKKFK